MASKKLAWVVKGSKKQTLNVLSKVTDSDKH